LIVDRVPLDESYGLQVEPLLANSPRIVYLCAPNNPTGTVIPRATIEEVVSRAPGVVLLDEAYFEFAGETAASLVREFPQLIVARTLSKAFGLAGLRVGYAIASPKMVRAIEAARGPYTVSAMSERAAAAAVELDGAWVREHVAKSVAARDRLTAALRQRGIDVPPSATNFVFAPIANAGAIAKAMRDRGVSVRPFAKIPQFCAALVESKGEALRITAGPDDEIDAALAVFDEARAACV
jgi:histidinol-phosphate aminotransferase